MPAVSLLRRAAVVRSLLGPEIQQLIASETGDTDQSFVDVQVSVQRRHGPKSWDIVIHAGPEQGQGPLKDRRRRRTHAGTALQIWATPGL